MRFRFKKGNTGKRVIDMTPMIDCVFQLLLFFMVASRFEDEAKVSGEGSLDANLPQAAAAMPLTMRPKELTVNINARGEYYVGGALHTEPQLTERLRRAEINNPGNQPVIIRGDERADWRFVARVMGICNQAGIRDYRVAVIPPDDSREGGAP